MTITINNKTLELVEVPEDAYFFSIYITKEGIPSVDFEILDDDCNPIDWNFIDLPTGYTYTILFKASEATEEHAADIVPLHKVYFGDRYPCYDGTTNWGFEAATESLHSLIRSLGMEVETTLVIEKIN